MAYFPLFLPMEQKKILFVGGGSIAGRRIRTLLPYGPSITVIAPEIDAQILALADTAPLVLCQRQYQNGDCAGFDLVFAATDVPAVNQAVGHEARQLGIPFNTADRKEDCDFYFPAIVETDDLVIGLSSGGKDHTLVKETAALLRRTLKGAASHEEDSHR